MEIDITEFYNNASPARFSASVAELGADAGRITWDAAMRATPLLDTADKLDAVRKWARSTGAWYEDEIVAWSDIEINALFVQLVSAEMRDKGEMSWAEYDEASSAGTVSGRLFKGVDGHIYIYVGE